MNNKGNDKPDDPGSDTEPEQKRPKFWGTVYILLGMISLAFSVYSLINSFGTVPLYGTVTASVLIGALGIFLIIYGYRILKRDY
jgi:hypothetical protein